MRIPSIKVKGKLLSSYKDILLTIFATSISIVLTFGTANYLEQRQMKKIRRHAAMLVIFDIEQSIDKVNKLKEEEEKNYNWAQRVMFQLNQNQEPAADTLHGVYKYLVDMGASPVEFDYGKERYFQANQVSWNRLKDNIKLVDLVQKFYNSRREFQELLNDLNFKHPISHQEYVEDRWNEGYNQSHQGFKNLIQKKINDKSVLYYLGASSKRVLLYSTYEQNWQTDAYAIKFLMGLTEEEYQNYIDKSEQMGKKASSKDIMGKMVEAGASFFSGVRELVFNDDHTFKCTFIRHVAPPVNMTGYSVHTSYYGGTWELSKGWLVFHNDPNSIGVTHDYSPLVCKSQEELDIYEKEIAGWWNVDVCKEAMNQNGPTSTYFVTVDESKKRFEMFKQVDNLLSREGVYYVKQ